MKKIIIILVLAIFTISASFGQKFTFGPKVGYSASKLSTNLPDITESVKHNFMAGLYLRIGNKLYVQPEFMYHTRGGILDSAGQVKQTIKFKNLEIPLMVGFKLLNLKIFNLRIMGGPVASFALGKDVTVEGLIEDPFQSADFKDIIWGLDVGLGIDVFFLTLDVRYEFGLNDVYSGVKSYNMKNNLFTIGLGFKLL